MLRETKHCITYPNKSVIEDLITRNGPAESWSYSPFAGKAEIVDNQFSGKQKHRFRINDFLIYCKNRDLDPSRIKATVTHDMLVETSNESAGYLTLEDMMPNGVEVKDVEDYIVMMCVGFKKDNTSPYRTNADKLTHTVSNVDGDSDSKVEEKYLINKNMSDMLTNEDYEEIIRELPHVIKSIWSYSKLYQANLFSFAFAYYDIVKTKHRNVTITDFSTYPTYLIAKDGTFMRRFSHEADNKYVIYPKVTKIFIAPESHKAEFNLCVKFLHMIESLGIDYRDEDPLMYNNDFVNNLICTFLPSNDQYMSEYKDIDAEIRAALKPENIFAVSKSHLYKPVDVVERTVDYNKSAFFILERIRMAYRLREYDDILDDHIDDTMFILQSVMTLANNGVEVSVPRHLINVEYNGLVYMNKTILTVPGKYFGSFKGSQNYQVALTRFGFIVALEESFDDVYYLSIEDCKAALERYKEDGEIQAEANWRVL